MNEMVMALADAPGLPDVVGLVRVVFQRQIRGVTEPMDVVPRPFCGTKP